MDRPIPLGEPRNIPVERVEFKATDSKLDESSPITTSVLITLKPRDGAGPKLVMVGLWLRNSQTPEEAARRFEAARQIERLLDEHVEGASFQVFD